MFFQSETVTVEKDRDGSAFLKIDVPGQTHNVITRQVLADLDAAFDAVAAEAGCRCSSSAAASRPASSPAPTCTASSKSPTPPRPRPCPPRASASSTSSPRCPCRRWPRSTAPVSAAVSNLPWPAITASSSTSRTRSSACPKCGSVCCPAGAARSGCRASSACGGRWKSSWRANGWGRAGAQGRAGRRGAGRRGGFAVAIGVSRNQRHSAGQKAVEGAAAADVGAAAAGIDRASAAA